MQMEPEDKTITGYGCCAYCGQQIMVECTEDMTQDQIDAKATLECKCELATAARHKREAEEQEKWDRQRRIDNAVLDIENLIGGAGHTDIALIMQQAVPCMVDGSFRKMVFSIDEKDTATMSIRNKKISIGLKRVNLDISESD